MKFIGKVIGTVCVCLLLTLILLPEQSQAATSYEDARVFYNTCEGKTYKVEFVNGQEAIYYATRGGKGSTSGKRYTSLGWEVRIAGGGKVISMAFQIDGKRERLYALFFLKK